MKRRLLSRILSLFGTPGSPINWSIPSFFGGSQAMYRVDKVGMVEKSAASNIDQMQSNIDLVLERGEKIDLLVEKTEALDSNAFKFERSAKVCWPELRMNTMWLSAHQCIQSTLTF